MVASEAGFSRFFPLSISSLSAQILPVFLRIGWKANHKASLAAIYICAIVLFLLIVVNLLYTFAHQRFSKDVNAAKTSSNSQKDISEKQ